MKIARPKQLFDMVEVVWDDATEAVLHYKGKHYEACWRLAGTTVLILDSDGDPTPVSAAAFKPDLPI